MLPTLQKPWFSWLLALVAMLYLSWVAYLTAPRSVTGLELDGWAIKIQQYYPERMPVSELYESPSLWKGPIIPTVYHFSYIVWPSPYSVLGCNILAFGLAIGLLHRLLVRYGHPIPATLAILGWIVLPYNRILFGYYFAEAMVALLSVIVLAFLLLCPKRPVLIGAAMGVLLLARPPFLLVAFGLPLVGWFVFETTRRERLTWSARYLLGLLLTFLPWGIRNLLVVGAFVPFTVEGGQTLFHGSYLPVEEDRWQVFHKLPDIEPLVEAAPKDPVKRMYYLSGLAKQQILSDPLGQLVRCVRKAMKFWVMLQPGTWVPEWKSGIIFGTLLLFGGCGLYRERRRPFFCWLGFWLLGLWAMHAIVFGTMRYSFPVQPFLIFFAATFFWPPAGESASTSSAQVGRDLT